MRERAPAAVSVLARKTAKALGFDLSDWIRMARRCRGLITVKPQKALRRLRECQKLTGADRTTALKRLPSDAAFLCYGDDTLSERVQPLRLIVGVPHQAWKRCIQRFPKILTLTPATFRKKVQAQRASSSSRRPTTRAS